MRQMANSELKGSGRGLIRGSFPLRNFTGVTVESFVEQTSVGLACLRSMGPPEHVAEEVSTRL
jgi:hypothetical protein